MSKDMSYFTYAFRKNYAADHPGTTNGGMIFNLDTGEQTSVVKRRAQDNLRAGSEDRTGFSLPNTNTRKPIG